MQEGAWRGLLVLVGAEAGQLAAVTGALKQKGLLLFKMFKATGFFPGHLFYHSKQSLKCQRMNPVREAHRQNVLASCQTSGTCGVIWTPGALQTEKHAEESWGSELFFCNHDTLRSQSQFWELE